MRLEAPPSTPSLFSGQGTGSATIGLGNEVGWTDHHADAWKKRLGDRRGALAVKGAVRRCGMDGLIDRASFAERPGAVGARPAYRHPLPTPSRNRLGLFSRRSVPIAGRHVAAGSDVLVCREGLGGPDPRRQRLRMANLRGSLTAHDVLAAGGDGSRPSLTVPTAVVAKGDGVGGVASTRFANPSDRGTLVPCIQCEH